MKKCLYCAEYIQDEAIYCRYCHKDLKEPTQESASKQPEGKKRPNWVYSGLFGVLIASLVAVSSIALGNRSLQDLILHFITNFLVYSAACGIIIWIWRKSWGKKVIGVFVFLAVFGLLLLMSINSSKGSDAVTLIQTPTVPVLVKSSEATPTITTIVSTITAIPLMVTPTAIILADHLVNCTSGVDTTSGSDSITAIHDMARDLGIDRPYNWQNCSCPKGTQDEVCISKAKSRMKANGFYLSSELGDEKTKTLEYGGITKDLILVYWSEEGQYLPGWVAISWNNKNDLTLP